MAINRKQKKTKRNKDLIFFAIVIPVIFIVGLISYNFLGKVAKNNRPVCKFLGNVWLFGTADPNVRKGCFSYNELYE